MHIVNRIGFDDADECMQCLHASPACRGAERAAQVETFSEAGDDAFTAEGSKRTFRRNICYEQPEGVGATID
jgi:hypothetical protein